ncbi:MAG: class I SAM-dependent methyltransferase [Candidatus Micrarchaeota archaeon]|nr:class I SAM-dependent methyltransferase [Candidatus Micrarchaeota archaeon]
MAEAKRRMQPERTDAHFTHKLADGLRDKTAKNVLEVGYGGGPMGIHFRSFILHVPDGVRYYGIEVPHGYPTARLWPRLGVTETEKEEMAKLEAEYLYLKPENIVLYRMDAANLKFPDGMFDEVHMHYFTTDPRIPLSTIANAVLEAKRVLKPDGALILIGETDMPALKLFGRGREEITEIIASGAGFSVSSGVEALRGSTVFSRHIEAAVEVRCGIEETFMLVARK